MSENTTGTGSPGEGPFEGVVSAAKAIESLMDSVPEEVDESNPEGQEANLEEEAEPAELEASDEEEQEEVDDSETEDTEEDESEEPADQLYTVTIDGKEQQVTLDELRDGYSRTSDYTRKTQALADERKAIESELEEARAERAEYAELLPKLRNTFQAGMGPEPDWARLRQEDPVKAAVMWQQREEQRRHLEALDAEEQRVLEQQRRDEAKAAERAQLQERDRLLEKLPEWKEEKVAKQEAAGIRKALSAVGFPEEQQRLGDHRYVLLARKAMLYDEMMAKRQSLDKKRSTAPVVKPGGGVPPAKGKGKQELGRLKKTGSVKDAASVFANLL